MNICAIAPRHLAWTTLLLALPIAVSTVISGCRKDDPVLLRSGKPFDPNAYRRKRSPNAANSLIDLARTSAQRKELRQHENGFGLFIADPEPSGDVAALRNVSRGYARWLRFAVGNQGELGKTPLWMTAERVLLEMEARRARVTLSEIGRVARAAGVTHTALGQLSGSPARCTLSFQVYAAADEAPVGDPIKVVGTTQQVTAALPDVARRLCSQLGVAQPRLPAATEESTEELAFIGSLPRMLNERFTGAQEARLREIADRTTLGKMLALDHSSTLQDVGAMNQRADQLAALIPDSPQLWATIGQCLYYTTTDHTRSDRKARIEELQRKYPQSFTANAALAFVRYPGKTYADAVAKAEEAVRCSVQNPDGWSVVAMLRSAQGDELRKGRGYNELSAAEREVLPLIYDRWLEATQRQADLDPYFPDVWQQVAVAATFAGEQGVAETSIWKALNAPKPGRMSFWWAFEMYDPKWFGKADELKRVANRAVAASYASQEDRVYVASLLENGGFSQQAKAVLKSLKGPAALANATQHVHSPKVEYLDSTTNYGLRIPPVVKTHPPNVQALYEHSGEARCVAWSPDGEALATGGRDRTVRVWRWPSGDPMVLSGHTRPINAVAWSADGARLASGSTDGTVRLWDARAGKQLKVLQCGGPVFSLAWSPNGQTFAAGGEDRVIRLWNGATGAPEGVLRGHQGRIRHLSYSPDGRYLASAADEMIAERLRLWSTAPGHAVKQFAVGVSPHYPIAWTADSKRIGVGDGRELTVLDPEADAAPRPAEESSAYSMLWLEWSADPRYYLATTGSRKFFLHDRTSSVYYQRHALTDHTNRARAFAWSPKRQRLATAGSDGQVLLWDLSSTLLKEMR